MPPPPLAASAVCARARFHRLLSRLTRLPYFVLSSLFRSAAFEIDGAASGSMLRNPRRLTDSSDEMETRMPIRGSRFSNELEQATTPSFGRMPQRSLAFTGSAAGSAEPRRALALSEASSRGERRRQASRGGGGRPLDLVRDFALHLSLRLI